MRLAAWVALLFLGEVAITIAACRFSLLGWLGVPIFLATAGWISLLLSGQMKLIGFLTIGVLLAILGLYIGAVVGINTWGEKIFG